MQYLCLRYELSYQKKLKVLIPEIEPEPSSEIGIILSYTTVQVDPLGIVTTTLPASVIGPALMAFLPELIV